MLTIGERLRIARDHKGVTQTQASKDTDINNKTLSGYERNVSEPDFQSIKTLAEYYDVSLDFLLGKTDKISPYRDNEVKPSLPSEFTSPEEAVKFLLEQNVIMGFGGFDVKKMSDEEVLEFANELLNQLRILSYKYKK